MSLRIPPLSVIATWPLPNYSDPVTHGPLLLSVNIVFLALATITLGLRLYTRAFIRKWLGLDDFFIGIAFIFTVGAHVVLNIGVLNLGWDRHIWDVRPEWIKGSLKNVYAGELLFELAAYFTAISLLSFYYRINRGSAIRWFSWALHLANIANTVLFIPCFFMAVFQCTPISVFWTFPPPADAHCIDPKIVVFGGGIVKLFIDLVITTLPIPLILRLNLPRAHKYSIIVLIALGYIVTATGAIRSYYTYLITFKTYDLTWYSHYVYVASTVENDLAVICASLPAIRPLLSKVCKKGDSLPESK